MSQTFLEHYILSTSTAYSITYHMLHDTAKTFLRSKRIWNIFQICLIIYIQYILHACIQFISTKVYTIETNIKHISNALKTYLLNELRCVEPFWNITSQINQLHAAWRIIFYTRVPRLFYDRNEYETYFKCLETYLFNELRCFEPFWSKTSQITQPHAA